MLPEATEFVIQGITVEGDIFQPADWAERLCNSLARAGSDGRKTYSSYVRAVMTDGIQAVAVRSGRGSRDAEASGPLPVMGKERRDPSRNIW